MAACLSVFQCKSFISYHIKNTSSQRSDQRGQQCWTRWSLTCILKKEINKNENEISQETVRLRGVKSRGRGWIIRLTTNTKSNISIAPLDLAHLPLGPFPTENKVGRPSSISGVCWSQTVCRRKYFTTS